MTQQRLAQVLAGVSLCWLAVSIMTYELFLQWVLYDTFNGQYSPQLSIVVNFLTEGGISLALVAAVLLLLWYWQARHRAPFMGVLVTTVLLVAVQDSGLPEFLFTGLQSPAMQHAIACMPSALLALVLLVAGFVPWHLAVPPANDSQEDAGLELRVEPLGAPAPD